MKNAINILLIILVSLLYSKTYSQNSLNGTYCRDYTLNDFGKCLKFEKEIFNYIHSGHNGINESGNGEYKISSDIIVLNYNKSEIRKKSYHISKIWKNNKDSINVVFEFLDFENKPIPYVNVFYKDSLLKKGYNGFVASKEGFVSYKLTKEKEVFEFSFSNIGFEQYKILIDKNFNYLISIFLEREGIGTPIKNQIDTLNIVELKSAFFKVKEKNGKITTWRKKRIN
ncbi:MAG: hypothetical protein V3V28_01340 [Polaribacter sp.]|uniref:hypothetical protein n=1 Tax=Polaribacter sp. TaxID=1920175 RepID=UPI002F34FF08